MNSVVLIVVAVILFAIAYVAYGGWLAKKWGFDPARKTPAHTLRDDVDYVPASAPVLLGHHFSSIAGAGPIVGPIAAAIFGWVPVFLWVVFGSIFFGGVHDMGSLFASVRHDSKSLGEVIGVNLGKKGKLLFSAFAWLTLLLVVAAFTNIVANTFVSVPSAATASMLFILLAIVFGFFVYRKGVNLALGTVLGVIGLALSIWVGQLYPLHLSANTWMIILLAYIFIASVTPVWILLQPRDYLNSFLLYGMLIGGIVGVFIFAPKIEIPAFTSFAVGEGAAVQYMFPFLFVTVACGAISGFHSLVGSGTTSKQLDSEKDLKVIGLGAMLIEGVLAIVALITVGFLATGQAAELGLKSPIAIFSYGLGTFMTSFGIPFELGNSFTALAISAFALTSLDTATRLARFIFQEAFAKAGENANQSANVLTNRYVSTGITVILSGILTFVGWSVIWPIFGSANQLLAAVALLALAVFLKKNGKKFSMIVLPMIVMFLVTLTALVLLIKNNIIGGAEDPKKYVLVFFAAALFLLSIVLIGLALKSFKKDDAVQQENK